MLVFSDNDITKIQLNQHEPVCMYVCMYVCMVLVLVLVQWQEHISFIMRGSVHQICVQAATMTMYFFLAPQW